VLNRTETSMPQAHVFLAMELAIRAEQQAQRIDPPKPTASVGVGRCTLRLALGS